MNNILHNSNVAVSIAKNLWSSKILRRRDKDAWKHA